MHYRDLGKQGWSGGGVLPGRFQHPQDVPITAQVDRLVAHTDQHMSGEGVVPGGAGKLERLGKGTVGGGVLADVIGHHPGAAA
jgi:hypothetical protein